MEETEAVTTSASTRPPISETSAAAAGGGDGDDLSMLTREELEVKIRKLQSHVKQLRNIILKRRHDGAGSLQNCDHLHLLNGEGDSGDDGIARRKKRKQERAFDFSRCPKRHVALKISYLGWSYAGLATQEDSEQTIEAHLFEALTKAKLIEARSSSNYHRCGRTDKGVSAFSQVISIDARCKNTSGLGVLPQSSETSGSDQRPNTDEIGNDNGVINDDLDKELDYCKILNRLLPRDIRVLAWAPVRRDFSARFDCVRRTYKYYFPEASEIDVERMKVAAQHLIGTHDFRNFCKQEHNQPPERKKSTVRTILNVNLQKVESLPNLYVFTIEGQSFIWHQIRCIVGILIVIGKGLEEPELVQQMLDVQAVPKKPQYAMAVDYPLNLFDVDHGNDVAQWRYDDAEYVLADFQKLWVQHAIKTAMITDMMATFNQQQAQSRRNSNPVLLLNEHLNSLIMGTKCRVYQKVLTRPTCERS